ncbi:MAG: hypothetical protein WBW33_17625 [Bryobacteraceae bacterium]
MLAISSYIAIGRQVDITRPSDDAVINKNALKKRRILQQREGTGQIFRTQLDTANKPVLKAHK